MLNKRLIKEARIKRLYIPANIVHSILNSIFIIINAYLLALVVDGVFIKKQSFQAVKMHILLFLLNAAIKSIFNFFIDNTVKKLSEHIKENIKKNTFNLIVSANPYKVKEQKNGELINILTEGSEMLTPYYSQYIPQFFASVIVPILICIFVAFKDPLSALIMLVTYPLIPFFMALIGYKSKEKNEQQWKKLTTLSSHFLDMLQGLRTLKVFGRSKIQVEKIYEISENYRRSTMDVLKVSFLSALVLETTAAISTAVVSVNLGLRLVYNKIDFFTAFFILVITPDFYIPLRQLGVKFHSSLNGQVAIEKVSAIEKVLSSDSHAAQEPLKAEKIASVEVKNLSFSHADKEALHNVSFKIISNEKIALVGDSGSGKSTLVNILSSFLKPEDNTVFINGININSLDKKYYLQKLAIVPQFPHIFNMSIEDNILLGNSISKEEFLNICRLTRVSDFAEKFKNKYKTVIGEGEDIAISGGEKQRIALARALVKKADIIILDEPTSALDPETEELLSRVINNILENKIVLIAAHRLNTIKSADNIFVLNNGFLIESGKHEELLKKKGKYYNMIKLAEEKL